MHQHKELSYFEGSQGVVQKSRYNVYNPLQQTVLEESLRLGPIRGRSWTQRLRLAVDSTAMSPAGFAIES